MKCRVSVNVTAKGLQSVRVTRGGDRSAKSSDTGKVLSLPPPPAWRFIDGNLGCAINRGDIK